MIGINSREKGKVGERELRDKLRELFPFLADGIRRGQQFSGIEGDDVVGLPGIHIECKRVEALNIDKAMEQSQKDAKTGEIPVVCHRKNHKEWLVTLRLSELVDLANCVRDMCPW